MKKFKSILALTASVLALSAFAAPVSAFAANDTYTYENNAGSWDDTPNDGTTNFSLQGPSESYIVTIPATIEFTALTGTGATQTGTIAATNVLLNAGKTLTVTATSTQYANGKYHLKNGDADIAYTATYGTDNVTTVSPDTTLLSVPSGTTEDSKALTFAIDANQSFTAAGTYTDVWTFTVATTP